jgi:hypothetical protein
MNVAVFGRTARDCLAAVREGGRALGVRSCSARGGGTQVLHRSRRGAACRDEVVVYEFSAGVKPGSVLWKADKVVDGEARADGGVRSRLRRTRRVLARASSSPPRVRIVWCVVVKGDTLSGSGWLLPGKRTVRTIDAKRDGAAPAPSPRSPSS